MTWGIDTSFPAGTIIMSNGVKPEHQDIAASLIITEFSIIKEYQVIVLSKITSFSGKANLEVLCSVVNYSLFVGLGFAGTVETNVNGGSNRGALYLGIGLASLGLCLSIFFTCLRLYRSR